MPPELGKSGNAEPVNIPRFGGSERWAEALKPSHVAMSLRAPYCARYHVSKLNPDAHVGWCEKEAFDKVGVSGGVSVAFGYQALVPHPHGVIVALPPMVGDDYPERVAAARASGS